MSTDPPPEITAAARKLAAKRFNERVKLFANTANAIGLGIFAVTTIVPNFGLPASEAAMGSHPWWTGPSAFLVLFCVAQISYRFLRSEE